MVLDDGAADGEAETDAIGLGGDKRRKGVGADDVGKPTAPVNHAHTYGAVVERPGADRQHAFTGTLTHRLNAVLHQIADDLFELDLVGQDGVQGLCQFEDELDRVGTGVKFGKAFCFSAL